MTEIPLAGGNVGGAVRVGDTVRRPTGPWTPAVHALLRHLEAAGLDGVPRLLGTDRRGREVLSFLPGRTVGEAADDAWPAWAWSDALLADVSRWLRRYHDAVRTFRPAGVLRWRLAERALGADEIVCHHDVAPYNVVVDPTTHRLVGVIDWDVAGPGRIEDDLGFAGWSFVPLFAALPAEEAARRVRLMASSYAVEPGVVLDAVEPRIRRAVSSIRGGAAAGDAGMLRLFAIGEADRTEARLDEFVARRGAIGAALAPR